MVAVKGSITFEGVADIIKRQAAEGTWSYTMLYDEREATSTLTQDETRQLLALIAQLAPFMAGAVEWRWSSTPTHPTAPGGCFLPPATSWGWTRLSSGIRSGRRRGWTESGSTSGSNDPGAGGAPGFGDNPVVPTLVNIEGERLERVLDATFPLWNDGLTRDNYSKFHIAQLQTDWGSRHLRIYALVDGDRLLASAKRYDLTAVISGRPAQVCGLGAVFTEPAHRGRGYAAELITGVLAEARDDGASFSLLFSAIGPDYYARLGFQTILAPPVTTIRVSESPRYGAPMTMIRGGDARDLNAMATMGRIRAAPSAFHLDRDVDFLQYGITKRRLLAGLGRPGTRELHFFIAEEGTTAAAYVVIGVTGSAWFVEECGDRDPTGARVGAILQALIAREPNERRPSIAAWLPPLFSPPQLTLSAAAEASELMMMRALGDIAVPRLAAGDVLYWRTDLF